MLKIEELKKAIKTAGEETIMAIYKHMLYAEKKDVDILLERENNIPSYETIKKILLHNNELLTAVYKYANEAEKTDLEILASAI